LIAEAGKLRRALAALDPRERSAAKPTPKRAQNRSERSASASARTRVPRSAASGKRAASEHGESSPVRTAPGAAKAKVLGALSTEGAMTAGEVAQATGLGRATVSTTLTKLAKSGEVANAERGYRLPVISAPAVPGAGSSEA
jgi:CRP-like cAMP-binding protein